jgi:TolB-like protein
VAEASHAVFLSYASQDAAAAQRIAEALQAGGIRVFLDQSELRGGDAWDQKIRHEIQDCALFIPIVSQHTQERLEGYFRREWKLAIDRTHDMADQKPFLVPVVIDGTRDQEAFVPDKFRAVQWTRLLGGETPSAFVERIRKLLSSVLPPLSAVSARAPGFGERVPAARRSKPALLAFAAAIFVAALAYLFADRFWISKHLALPAAEFAPPAHSIAVLPFVNMSPDKNQEYLSDGLTEELLNSLAEINDLQVAARTSAFSFKGTNTDIGSIARKLNVGAVLEGSVRRSGNTVRIAVELINALTGFHLWSQTYDRDLGDVLKLETEIAAAVASALKVSLLGDVATRIELGGTRNPGAFDAYLRGRKAVTAAHSDEDLQAAITAYTEAIELDPNYALALAHRSAALSFLAGQASGPVVRQSFDKALIDARNAVGLTPDLAEGHLALARYFSDGALDFTAANEEYELALALAPGNARVLRVYGGFAVLMGRTAAAIAVARRAVALDPLNAVAHSTLGLVLYDARQYEKAIAAFQNAVALNPDRGRTYSNRGLAYYASGNLQSARESCETKPDDLFSQVCLALTYHGLGRKRDAEAQLAKIRVSQGDDSAFQYAEIYAQWGSIGEALDSLETALRLHDPGLAEMKVDALLDSLRGEPRFQAVMRELKFPE